MTIASSNSIVSCALLISHAKILLLPILGKLSARGFPSPYNTHVNWTPKGFKPEVSLIILHTYTEGMWKMSLFMLQHRCLHLGLVLTASEGTLDRPVVLKVVAVFRWSRKCALSTRAKLQLVYILALSP